MRVFVGRRCAGVLLAASIAACAAWSPSYAQTPGGGDSVTVTGKRPLKPCGEGDKGCILAVAKAVWTRYPRQIARYCLAQIVDKAISWGWPIGALPTPRATMNCHRR